MGVLEDVENYSDGEGEEKDERDAVMEHFVEGARQSKPLSEV